MPSRNSTALRSTTCTWAMDHQPALRRIIHARRSERTNPARIFGVQRFLPITDCMKAVSPRS